MDNDRRQRYLSRYTEQKAQGESFFPHTIHKDALFTLLVFLILVALAVFVGAPLEDRADPTNTAYIPRPEWYFMFLFEMLKYFPGQLEWVGVAVVPGAVILFLFLLPVLDRNTVRHPRQRRLAVNLTALAVVAVTFLTLQAYQVTPTTAMSLITSGVQIDSAAPKVIEPQLTAGQQTGRQLFQTQGCTSCHKLAGKGGSVGPDLTHVGSRHDLAWLHEYIANPKSHNPQARMPAFVPPMTHQQVEWVAQYLSTLR